MQQQEADEYVVLQAIGPTGDPLDTYHIFRAGRRIASDLSPTRVRAYFDGRYLRPVRDESRMPRCEICNIAMPEGVPRHVQTPDGQVARGHRWVRPR